MPRRFKRHREVQRRKAIRANGRAYMRAMNAPVRKDYVRKPGKGATLAWEREQKAAEHWHKVYMSEAVKIQMEVNAMKLEGEERSEELEKRLRPVELKIAFLEYHLRQFGEERGFYAP
jgi:hypothetical protein